MVSVFLAASKGGSGGEGGVSETTRGDERE